MKSYIADFTEEKNQLEFGSLSETLLRELDEDAIILQMLQHHDQNINMGLDDTKAPYFEKGVQHYLDHGYTVGLRNSGGRSVANDLGVFNFSLISKVKYSTEELYFFFYNFLKDALAPLDLDIRVGLVEGAYCPGTFDISIGGKKIAGTAQRRIKDNVLVGAYLSVNGDQFRRSNVIKEFYEISKGPIIVDVNKLTTLEDEYKSELSVASVKSLIIKQFEKQFGSATQIDLDEIRIMKSYQMNRERLINQDIKFLK